MPRFDNSNNNTGCFASLVEHSMCPIASNGLVRTPMWSAFVLWMWSYWVGKRGYSTSRTWLHPTGRNPRGNLQQVRQVPGSGDLPDELFPFAWRTISSGWITNSQSSYLRFRMCFQRQKWSCGLRRCPNPESPSTSKVPIQISSGVSVLAKLPHCNVLMRWNLTTKIGHKSIRCNPFHDGETDGGPCCTNVVALGKKSIHKSCSMPKVPSWK